MVRVIRHFVDHALDLGEGDENRVERILVQAPQL